MSNSRICVHCSHPFGSREFIEHFIQFHNNKIYCSECQERNYIVGADKNSLFKILNLLLGLLWLPLSIIAFMIFHKSAITPGVVVISVGHFVFAFLGACLGVLLSRAARQILRWHFGHTAREDRDYDYQL